jgi:thiol:disulfide interchange protein DsbG
VPALKHVASTGATILDLGERHGLHSVAARVGDQFMILQVAPDGQAVVGGPVLELSEARLMAIGGAQVTDIGESHGLKGLFLRNGSEFQVLYATPDRQAMIAGVMWDSAGKNLTRDQVGKIDGAIPTVVVSDGDKEFAAKAVESGLAVVKQATFGVYGRDGAPELWMIVDPACTYSIRALDQLKPFVEAGRVQLRIVPISILDHEDNGMSTRAALALLSNPLEHMASLWMQRNFGGQPTAEAAAKLQKNGQISEAIKLTGTPTFLFRKPDGSEGRLDGMPTDIKALLAEVSGRR